jgi:hypothetical protein
MSSEKGGERAAPGIPATAQETRLVEVIAGSPVDSAAMDIPAQDNDKAKAHLRVRYPQLFDWVSMALYVLLVYGWIVNVYPMGRDYVEQEVPGVLAPLWLGLQGVSGGAFWPYHVVNIVLMYGCMIAVFYLMKLVYNGPWWIGTLAAVLFMANPVHTESVANLCGMLDLLPCFLALVALNAYCLAERSKNSLWLVFAVPLFIFAAFTATANLGLLIVLALFELILSSDDIRRRLIRLVPMALVAAVAGWLHGGDVVAHGGDVARMFGPLYFLFYPIGVLPSTAQLLHEHFWLGWIGAAAVVAVFILIYRKARRAAILFGLLSVPALRLFGGGRDIDPVHLVGGGELLLCGAMFAIAVTVVFHRIMDHPKWRRIVVNGTYLLCVLLIVVQVHALLQWRAAGNMLRDFHSQIAQAIGGHEVQNTSESLLVSPNIQYLDGAPLCMSESLVFEARTIPYRPPLPLFAGDIIGTPYVNVFERKGVRMQTSLEEDTITLLVEGAEAAAIVPLDAPPGLSVDAQGDGRVRIQVPLERTSPHLLVIPGEYPWLSSDS